jgi:hypothetical protein
MTDYPVANCEKDEVNIALDAQGDRRSSCACGFHLINPFHAFFSYSHNMRFNEQGARHLAGCCKVSDPPPPRVTCERTTCEINPLLCTTTTDDYGVPDTTALKRDVEYLGKRGPPNPYRWTTLGAHKMVGWSRRHGNGDDYMRLLASRLAGLSDHYYAMRGRDCTRRQLGQFQIVTQEAPARTQVEHIVPVSP